MSKDSEIIIGVVDGGGRGHAITEAYLEDPRVRAVHAFPGNDFMKVGNEGRVFTHADITTKDRDKIIQACLDQGVTYLDVAQDDAVAAGVADAAREVGILTLGPSAKAGTIESSKIHGRELASRIGLDQPDYLACYSEQDGYDAIDFMPYKRFFIKADGLAAGKGAMAARSIDEARERVRQLASFGEAGKKFTVEEWLQGDDGTPGEEFSAFAINGKLLGFAQDHKTVFDHDEGENTGGMGCVNNPMILTPELQATVADMLKRTYQALEDEGTPYNGVMYLGGMLVRRNGVLVPNVIEFNARWGDPEAEVILPLITNLLGLGMAAAEGSKLEDVQIYPSERSRMVIAIASKGYPGNYDEVKNKEIFGIDEAREMPGATLYGAGVRTQEVGPEKYRYFANGGRLLYVVGEGADILEAKRRAYGAASLIHIDGNNGHYRTDIGYRDVARFYAQKAT